MAAVDTIVVLDNLDFEHLNTADIYTVHDDGQDGEALVTKPIYVPCLSLLGARVLINNNGATGSTVAARVRETKTSGITTTTVTKTQNTQSMEWNSIALNAAMVAGTEITLTNIYELMIHVDVALVGTTASLGVEIIVEVRKEVTVSEWTVYQRFNVLSGKTAFKTDLSDTAAAAQKVIPVANPTAGNLNHINKRLFILDATIANSEIVWQTECGADA